MTTHPWMWGLVSAAALVVVAACDGDGPSGGDGPAGSGGSEGGGSNAGGTSSEGGNGGNGGNGGTGGTRLDECDDAPSELALEFQRLPVEGVEEATDFAFFSGSDEFLLTATGGTLFHGRVEEGSVSVLSSWELEADVVPERACGLTNVLFDPEFDENSFIYMTYCLGDMTHTQLVRYEFDVQAGPRNPAVIFETTDGHSGEPWHRFGSMGFEPNGETLWVYSGDHFQEDTAQDPSVPKGAILRLVPNRESDGDGHTYPDGNMGGGMGGAGSTPHPGVYAYGLRSPWRGTLDAAGRFWVGDVGLGRVEEVDLATEAGQNFGWSDAEGPCEENCDGLVDPIVSYDREAAHPYIADDPETAASTQRAIWVGQIHEDVAQDRYCGLMDGMVVFGDLFTGWVRGLRVNDEGEVTFDESLGNLPTVTQWRVAPDGYAYALRLDGDLYRAKLVE